MVQVKRGDAKMTYIYVMPLHENQNGYNLLHNGGLPPAQTPQEGPPAAPSQPKGLYSRLLRWCKKAPADETGGQQTSRKMKLPCWSKSNSNNKDQATERIDSDISLIHDEAASQPVKWWQRLKCCKRNKVSGISPKNQRKRSWTAQQDSHAGEPTNRSRKDRCKDALRTVFCLNLCSKKRKAEEEAANRRESMMSKKKSLTPPVVVEDSKQKLDAGLVEHTSLMKGAIPVLPVYLAWLCLILNVFLPGTGTILSGFLCLCMGIPRFSTKDGAKQRVGACIIDFFIGCGQLFTVLFCLVGWGWSIWWGVTMIKIAKKYRKIRRAEKAMEEDVPALASRGNHLADVERGS